MRIPHGFAFLVTTAFLMKLATDGNFDLEIHSAPKPIDQGVKKAGDGGANETKEH